VFSGFSYVATIQWQYSVMWLLCHVSLYQQSQESVQAKKLEQKRVTICVTMTVTVRTMRNAAAMDVDISVWLHLQVFMLLY